MVREWTADPRSDQDFDDGAGKESKMYQGKIAQIKEGLAQGTDNFTREEVEWLVKRVEELEKENEWLKHELSYAENQGEISYWGQKMNHRRGC
jgi:hypothetical protein